MKNRIIGTFTLTFLLVLLFTLPKKLSATVYYVAPNGSDSNSGKSLDVPLSTLTKAAELLKPGETVFVRAGVYTVNEPIVIFCSETEDQPVVFKNYDPERPVFNFSGIPGKSSGITGISFLKGSQSGEMTAEISDFGGEKLECHFPLAKNMDEWSDYSKKFFQLNISDIEVTNGDCTITFSVAGNTGDYALIDDVVLYRY